MILESDYEDFLLEITKYFQSMGFTVPDMLLKVSEENGEAAEAWILHQGLKERKGTAQEVDVASELADVAAAAMMTIVALGFQPSHMLEGQMEKMRKRFLDDPA